ncbi:hypothetical protein AB0I34_06950 [Kribbella sp. NPDC050281]
MISEETLDAIEAGLVELIAELRQLADSGRGSDGPAGDEEPPQGT